MMIVVVWAVAVAATVVLVVVGIVGSRRFESDVERERDEALDREIAELLSG